MTNPPPVPPHDPNQNPGQGYPDQPVANGSYPAPGYGYQGPPAANVPYQVSGQGYQPAMPPAKKRKKWPFVVGAIVLLIVLGAALSGNDEDSSSESANSGTNTSTSDSTATPATGDSKDAATAPGLNTAVRDGKFEFTVTDVATGLSSVGDNPYLKQEAQGQFVVVTIEVENIGDKPQSFSPSAQKLVDNKDRTFESDTTAQIALGGSDIPVWDNINPGNSVNVKLVFDMPKNATPASIELHDSLFSNGAKVSLK
ncbi:DUF4352 domain-containing protein [Gordonia hydrophobica]|uniref:DUF4352 domain-containing protein n=1 Tax=Gordonia hydrophobica TaxID=40516 RepID=A0ABZ2U1F7_9ACTN|nr:DUF4352 domain-containing protein [Gordonia hydrophobica]MBM7368526.1 hypothetical protein [Gordonia hydrophobica]